MTLIGIYLRYGTKLYIVTSTVFCTITPAATRNSCNRGILITVFNHMMTWGNCVPPQDICLFLYKTWGGRAPCQMYNCTQLVLNKLLFPSTDNRLFYFVACSFYLTLLATDYRALKLSTMTCFFNWEWIKISFYHACTLLWLMMISYPASDFSVMKLFGGCGICMLYHQPTGDIVCMTGQKTFLVGLGHHIEWPQKSLDWNLLESFPLWLI